ncbi:MAG: hypothetical protein IPM17_00120 [Verrucomicrobia bacterium]|nr:hypothetical protein [Verrucomicrobiota bacterium]
MNSSLSRSSGFAPWAVGLLCVGWLCGVPAKAFPPAPHHMVYGTVRDEMGNPLGGTSAEVWLEAQGRTLVRAPIAPSAEPGVNYRLNIPMDAGATADLYKPTALRPTVPFRMRVRVGNVTYLPIEMTGASQLLTRPGAASRVDLTLGVDSDGDGLPDAWERALIQMLGGNLGLEDIRPEDDSDGDGLSNLDEYLAGTYAFDPEDGFVVAIVPGSAEQPVLEFTAIRGRSYSILASETMESWTPVSFNLPGDPEGAAGRSNLRAADTRLIRARVPPAGEGGQTYRFFKLEVR